QNPLSPLGQRQRATGALEQRLAHALLQLADLCRQCGLRQVQLLGHAGQLADGGDAPEIIQMVVVEPVHGRSRGCPDCSIKQNYTSIYIYFTKYKKTPTLHLIRVVECIMSLFSLLLVSPALAYLL